MAETEKAIQEMQPAWVQGLIKWIGVVTAVVLAVAGLLAAFGKLGDASELVCRTAGRLPWCVSQPVEKKAPPQLAAYDSPEVGGGHNQAEYCEPRKAAYQSQHPDFYIGWKASETEMKDWKSYVTRRYHCEFTATPR